MKKDKVVCVGEALIDRIRNKSNQGFTDFLGGAPANVACALRKLKIDSAFIGCLGDDDFGKKLAMHIAATSPLAMSENDLDSDLVDREKKIISEQLVSEGKPADIAEKILSGKLKKFYEENTLLNQKFVMDPDSSIRQVLEKNNQVLINFVRFKVGEGIDKKESDFATEVKDIVN